MGSKVVSLHFKTVFTILVTAARHILKGMCEEKQDDKKNITSFDKNVTW